MCVCAEQTPAEALYSRGLKFGVFFLCEPFASLRLHHHRISYTYTHDSKLYFLFRLGCQWDLWLLCERATILLIYTTEGFTYIPAQTLRSTLK